VALNGAVTDIKPTLTVNLFKYRYAKCHIERTEFHKYMADARRDVDVRDAEILAFSWQELLAREMLEHRVNGKWIHTISFKLRL
jgi:hypothetical protein